MALVLVLREETRCEKSHSFNETFTSQYARKRSIHEKSPSSLPYACKGRDQEFLNHAEALKIKHATSNSSCESAQDVALLTDLRALKECCDEGLLSEEEYRAQREALHLGAEPRRGEI